MIKVLIADDEDMIRRGIAKLLADDDEIEVVAQAEDGETALELAEKHRPDLLLVDINMPFLNGLDFIEKLGGVLDDPIVIIISGYDDFEYAQRSIQLGVFDYLLKPVMEQPFYDCIRRAKERLASSQKQVEYQQWAREQLEKNKPTLLSGFLNEWLQGMYTTSEIDQQLDYLGISLPRPFGMTVVHGTLDAMEAADRHRWDDILLYYAMENIAREVFERLSPAATFKDRRGDLVLLSGCEPLHIWQQSAARTQQLLKQHLLLDAVVVQAVCETTSHMPEAYESTTECLYQNTHLSNLIKTAQRYINDNYTDSALSLQGAAEHIGVSSSYLSRLFRHESGLTFKEYITKLRIRRATELLATGDYKIYEVAEMVGYANQHYFSNAFKRVLGLPPKDYRRGMGV